MSAPVRVVPLRCKLTAHCLIAQIRVVDVTSSNGKFAHLLPIHRGIPFAASSYVLSVHMSPATYVALLSAPSEPIREQAV